MSMFFFVYGLLYHAVQAQSEQEREIHRELGSVTKILKYIKKVLYLYIVSNNVLAGAGVIFHPPHQALICG